MTGLGTDATFRPRFETSPRSALSSAPRSVRCSSVPWKSIRAERSQRVDDRRGEIAVQNGPFVFVYDKSVIDVSVVMVDGSASRKAPDYLDAVPQTVIGVYLRFDPLVASDDDRRPVDIEEQNVP